MSVTMTNGDTPPACFAAEGALERVDEQYLFDADPGADGCMFLIPEDGILSLAETGKQKRYPGGQARPIFRVLIRKGCDAVRLEHVRMSAGLLAGLQLHCDTDFAIDFAPPGGDSGVVLVPAEDEVDLTAPFVAEALTPGR
jgi:hypothetical protein